MRQLTHGPRHHFLGRAGVRPWNASGTRLACLETEFQNHAPQRGQRASVGIVDRGTGGFTAVATTAAWNFTRGANIEWCPQSPNDEILFNDIVDGAAVGVRLNVNTGARQVYIRPFEAAGGEGACAASLGLGRISRLNPGEGIDGPADPAPDDPAPETDGISLVGLTTGVHRLVLPLAAVAACACEIQPKHRRREFWIENVSFNRTGTRMLFTVCAGGRTTRTDTALFSAAVDGSDLRVLQPFGRGARGGVWLDATRCVVVSRHDRGMLMPRIVSDSADPSETAVDGAPSNTLRAVPSPDALKLAVESENPRRRSRALSVVDILSGVTRHAGDFRAVEEEHFSGPARCELSPRWSADGRTICVDAIGGEGTRQLHLVSI